ncbi:protein phosphatase 2C, putative [Bodo saltans]|uniref:Protein phosphatase 2C, putative n=2 Tax=Bodo saltans TaxID=75058 RepID=A0A0S4IM91_BODSA|nr:protein phosphatase 2C, putative [Bodo saltans]|eukprot:CUF40664.1 protein phosphatase 2C, putative [Bodo saltans]
MLNSFPLQTKHLRSLAAPWMNIGLCEVMNAKPKVNTAGFVFHNNDSMVPPRDDGKQQSYGAGATVGAGVFDSYEGSTCSHFVASEMQFALSRHVSNFQKQRQLLRNIPPHSSMAQALGTYHALRSTITSTVGRSDEEGFVDGELLSLYAQSIDNAFFEKCRREIGPNWGSSGVEHVGCRGAWFASTLQFDASAQKHHVKVVAANVGDCRTFVVAVNPKTSALKSELEPKRSRVAQLSMDHGPFRDEDFGRIRLAGGVVQGKEHGLIDGHPHMNVARAFGYWCMKNNQNLSRPRQKVVSKPSVRSTTLHAGDVVISLNFSCFETRSGDTSIVDDIAQVVVEALTEGASPSEAAGAICDHAMAFGAHHSLIAAVAVVAPDLANLRSSGFADAEESIIPVHTTSVAPGPFYPNLSMSSQEWKLGLLTDVQRCGLRLDQWLELRYNSLRSQISASGMNKSSSHLSGLFPCEMRMIRRQIQEECEFFDLEPGPDFEKLASRLSKPALTSR